MYLGQGHTVEEPSVATVVSVQAFTVGLSLNRLANFPDRNQALHALTRTAVDLFRRWSSSAESGIGIIYSVGVVWSCDGGNRATSPGRAPTNSPRQWRRICLSVRDQAENIKRIQEGSRPTVLVRRGWQDEELSRASVLLWALLPRD